MPGEGMQGIGAATRRRLLPFGLLVVHAGMLLYCACRDFVTYDEVGNIAAGISYWETGQFALYSVNPPLTKLIATLPVVITGPDTSAIVVTDTPGLRNEWDIGDFFARANASRYHEYVILSRLAGIGWSVIGGWIIYLWANQLFGRPCGLVGLAAWCLEPNVITHAHYLTADVPAAVAALAATYAFWWFLRTHSWRFCLLAGAVLGVAQLVKFTLLPLYPIWVATWLLARLVERGRGQPIIVSCAQLVCMLGSSVLVINAGYGFEGSGKHLGDYQFVSRTLKGSAVKRNSAGVTYGNKFSNTWAGAVLVPLPEHYLRGMDVQRRGFESYERQQNFLRGEWKVGGWWYYYLYAAAVKVPTGLLILLIVSALVLFARRPGRSQDLFLLSLIPFAVIVLVSSQTSMNKHLRYIMPAFPYCTLFIALTGVVYQLPHFWPRAAVTSLMAWAAVSSLSVYPCSISYFNELAGGPTRGHLHLSGSNVDLGQDLWRLKEWVDAHPDPRPLKLAYHNHIDPRITGLRYELPPLGPDERKLPSSREAQLELGPHPGRYAISVRYLQGNSGSPPDGQGGYNTRVPFKGYAYFQRFQPVAHVGYTIFIYDITLDEANYVRHLYGLEPISTNN